MRPMHPNENDVRPRRIAVVGAGVSGLVAASVVAASSSPVSRSPDAMPITRPSASRSPRAMEIRRVRLLTLTFPPKCRVDRVTREEGPAGAGPSSSIWRFEKR